VYYYTQMSCIICADTALWKFLNKEEHAQLKAEYIEKEKAARILLLLKESDWDSEDEEDDLHNMLGPGIRDARFR
jgi:hypothetical protein